MNAIETSALCKSYGSREVLHGIDLVVPQASVFGFLGPNGAGKSTTIRILMGLLRASSGTTRVLDRDPWQNGPDLRRRIGYLPGDLSLYPTMRGRALLMFMMQARGEDSTKEMERLAERFRIDLGLRIRACSRGMKQKLGIIQALMHRPDVLILDEPTTGLDPLMQEVLRDELQAAAARGQTVLFSSHTLSEVEQLCDRIAIVRDGNLIEQDTIASLRSRALRRVTMSLDQPIPDFPDAWQPVERRDSEHTGVWVGTTDELLHWLSNLRLHDVTISPPDLEDLFMTYYGDEKASAVQEAS